MRLIKKLLAVVLVLTMVVALIPTTAAANDTITVTIDGQRVTFADQQPVIINNRTLVPVGGVFEALGFTPSWSGSAQTATLTRADYTVVITIGSATFTTNGVEYTLDVPAQIINNRTMLPLRAVLESIGTAPDNIGWDGNTRAITIITDVGITSPVDPVDAEAELAEFLSGMNTNAIRDALGVNFTVGMTEYIIDLDRNTVQSYRILHLDGELDIDVSTTLEGSRTWTTMFNTQTGDVTLHRLVVEHATTPVARYLVRVDIGSALDVAAVTGWQLEDWVDETHRVHHFILVADLYNEEVDVITPQQEQRLAQFNMSHQYTSDNFYWYSNNARSRFLPTIARALEIRTSEITDLLGITISEPILVFYYARADFYAAYAHYSWVDNEPMGYPGFAWGNGFSAARPITSTTVTPMTIGHFGHEMVHVLQSRYFPPDWGAMYHSELEWLGWVSEGTATYLGHGREIYAPIVMRYFQSNNLPTLAQLSDNDQFFGDDGWTNYCWAATIFEFIHETWGIEYVVEMNRRHGDFDGIFGFSQDEFQRQWHQWLRDNFR